MKIIDFPLPIATLRSSLQKLGLWLSTEPNQQFFLADIKQSYQRCVLACHPDSRRNTSHDQPSVHEIVDAYKNLAACFKGAQSANVSQMYIHKSSLNESTRFDIDRRFAAGSKSRFSAQHDKWDKFLNQQSMHVDRHRQSFQPGADKRRTSRFYNVRSAPSRHRAEEKHDDSKKKCTEAKPTTAAKSQTKAWEEVDDDIGCWYSRDILKPDKRA